MAPKCRIRTYFFAINVLLFYRKVKNINQSESRFSNPSNFFFVFDVVWRSIAKSMIGEATDGALPTIVSSTQCAEHSDLPGLVYKDMKGRDAVGASGEKKRNRGTRRRKKQEKPIGLEGAALDGKEASVGSATGTGPNVTSNDILPKQQKPRGEKSQGLRPLPRPQSLYSVLADDLESVSHKELRKIHAADDIEEFMDSEDFQRWMADNDYLDLPDFDDDGDF